MVGDLTYSKRLLRSAAIGVLCAVLGACALSPTERNEPLATVLPARGLMQLTSTGFFVDRAGHVLTAGHAVEGCRRILVTQNGETLEASLVARSKVKDLALLQVDRTLGSPAVFARETDVAKPELAFAAGYQTLPRLLAEGGALSNAVVTNSREPRGLQSDLELISDASFGTSGAPVLGATGLAIGVVTHKASTGKVMAANGENAKAFLIDGGIAIQQDDKPQLSAMQDRAAFAAAMSVTVACPQ